MISQKECITEILENFPGFQPQWQRHIEYWGNEEPGLCNDLSEFSDYVSDLIADKKNKKLNDIFELIEKFMVEGEQSVKEAVSTCFLENLINTLPSDSTKIFVNLLGSESSAYCVAWDEFTGVKTEGLIDKSLQAKEDLVRARGDLK
jgi:hypothetical protein